VGAGILMGKLFVRAWVNTLKKNVPQIPSVIPVATIVKGHVEVASATLVQKGTVKRFLALRIPKIVANLLCCSRSL
jgi:hypothetical protein